MWSIHGWNMARVGGQTLQAGAWGQEVGDVRTTQAVGDQGSLTIVRLVHHCTWLRLCACWLEALEHMLQPLPWST